MLKNTIKFLALTVLMGTSNISFSKEYNHYKGIGFNLIENHLKQKKLVNFLHWYSLTDKERMAFFETVIGKLYYQGKFVKQNSQEAFKFFKLAAEDGFKEAQFNLAVMYEEGKATERNYNEAIKWYTAAALQGHVDAQFHLGLVYIKAHNKDKALANDEELIKWWMLAASQGHQGAKYWLEIIEKFAQSESL